MGFLQMGNSVRHFAVAIACVTSSFYFGATVRDLLLGSGRLRFRSAALWKRSLRDGTGDTILHVNFLAVYILAQRIY